MSEKQRLRDQLTAARRFSENLLEAFQKPSDWVFQPHPGANHALWFMGHMGNSDNFFLALVKPQLAIDQAQYGEKFGIGSQPVADLEQYPPVEDVRAYMRDRREKLLAALDSFDEADLATKTPAGTPDFLSDFGSVFQTAGWHEGMHAGQLSVARRALGHKPIMG